MNAKIKNIAGLVILLLSIYGCGYYNPYVVGSNSKPITLHRSMWPNHTNELGLETTFYHAQSDWLRKSKLITLSEKPEEAQYLLSGLIIRVDYPELSYGAHREATELRANLTVNFSITDSATGKKILEKSNYTVSETLFMSSNPIQLQANKKAALAEIADDVAEEIYLHIINSIMRPESE